MLYRAEKASTELQIKAICALIRDEMSNKEIAVNRNLNKNSVVLGQNILPLGCALYCPHINLHDITTMLLKHFVCHSQVSGSPTWPYKLENQTEESMFVGRSG